MAKPNSRRKTKKNGFSRKIRKNLEVTPQRPLKNAGIKIEDLLPRDFYYAEKRKLEKRKLARGRRTDPYDIRRAEQQYWNKLKRERDAKLLAVSIRERTYRETGRLPGDAELARLAEMDRKRRDVCEKRRKVRKALFLKKIIGKGKSGPKKREWTPDSKVRC